MPGDAQVADFDAEELSETTLVILISLGGFFALAALVVLFKLVKSVSKKPRSPANGREPIAVKPKRRPQPRAPSPETTPSETSKPGVSLKTLLKQSKKATSVHAAKDIPVDHPLYLSLVKGFQDVVTGISFSPDGGHLAVACEDRVLRVFSIDDANSKSFAFKFKSLTREPVDVAFGATKDLFVLTKGGVDSAVLEKYDYTPGAKGDAIHFCWEVKGVHGKDPAKGLRGGATPHGHSLVLSFSTESSLQVYSATGTHLAAVSSGGLKNHEAAISRDGRFFGAATFTSDVRLSEVQFSRAGEFKGVHKVMDLKKAHDGQVFGLAFSPDGKKAVTASKDGSWAVWNIDVRYELEEDPKVLLRRPQETGLERYKLLAFGAHGVVAAAFGRTLHFLDSQSGNLLEVVEVAHDADISAMEWSPVPLRLGKGKTEALVTSGLDRRVRIWRAPMV